VRDVSVNEITDVQSIVRRWITRQNEYTEVLLLDEINGFEYITVRCLDKLISHAYRVSNC